MNRFKKQMDFIIEIDKIKDIFRQTKLFDGSRHENDAEHSWHLAVMAVILCEYSNVPIDVSKVIKMVLIHDIVEIDAGDYLVYTPHTTEKKEKETAAATRIFGILPEDQREEMMGLWNEFEERHTPEAKFAAALDRLEPVMQNYFTNAYTWRKNQIQSEQVFHVNQKIALGSEKLWEYAQSLIEECLDEKFAG